MVVVDNSGNRRVLKVKDKKIKHFKVMLDLGQLINTNFGVHYQVIDPKSGELQVVTDVKLLTKAFLDDVVTAGGGADDDQGDNGDEQEEQVEEVKDAIAGVTGKDNRDIVDNNQA